MVSDVPLSVIIPTYNRAEMLERALVSITNQSVLPQELIIIDDGSTDSTENLVHRFETGAINLKYHRQLNQGPAAARNRGVELATNDIISFLDSDDHWHKRKIDIQFSELKKNPNYRISHTREKWLRRGKHLNQKKIHRPPAGVIFDSCLKLCCVGMSTVMMYRSLFDDYGFFDENLRCCEDYDLWLRVAQQEPFLLIDHPLTIKEGGRDDQVSSIYRIGMDKYRIYALSKLIKSESLSKEQLMLVRKTLQEKCMIYGNGCIKHGKIAEGKEILTLAEHYRA